MREFSDLSLGKYLKLTCGYPFASSQFSNEGFPLIRIRDVSSMQPETFFQGAFPPGYIIKKGDILIGMDGDFNVVRWRGPDALLNQRVLKVEVQNESSVALEYLFHWLGPFVKKVNDITAATTVKHLSTKDLTGARGSFPDVCAQRKIAAVLTTTDTAIEKTEALIAKYQQIKAGLMHDLFTRGVLPNGQLRPPRSEAPELYHETAIGWIPREWDAVQAGSLCSLITKGTTPASHEMWQDGDGIRFLRVDNLTFDGELTYDASSFRIAEKTHLGNLARSRCLPGDVLTNIVGPPLGKVGLVTTPMGELNINQAIAVFRPRGDLNSLFLLRWLTTERVKRWFLQRAKQTSGQLNLTLAMCQALPIPAMSLVEQNLILERAESCEKLIRAELVKLHLLKAKKLGLMQDLLTGKVPVPIDEPEAAHA